MSVLLTKAQAAEALTMSVRSLDKHIRRGEIVPIKDGRWVRISDAEVRRFVLNLQRRAVHLDPVSVVEFLTGKEAGA